MSESVPSPLVTPVVPPPEAEELAKTLSGNPAPTGEGVGEGVVQQTAAALGPNLRTLEKLRLFRGISTPGLERIAKIAREEAFATGAVIFHEGDFGDRLYIIVQGQVRISRDVAGMGEEALAVLGPGDAFGEMSIIDDVPRSADAIAHEDCRLLVIGRAEMEDLLLMQRDLAYEILWNFVRVLTARLRDTNDKMTFLSMTAKF